MMLFRAIVLWTVQVLLFGIGIGTAGLLARLFGPIIGQAFAIDELIPTALIFFTMAAALGWLGNRFWPEDWMHNPLL
jgi:MFS-type transporter involved in bile tolerance (Atg22 family)